MLFLTSLILILQHVVHVESNECSAITKHNGRSVTTKFSCGSSQSCCGTSCCEEIYKSWILWTVTVGLLLLCCGSGCIVRCTKKNKGRVNVTEIAAVDPTAQPSAPVQPKPVIIVNPITGELHQLHENAAPPPYMESDPYPNGVHNSPRYNPSWMANQQFTGINSHTYEHTNLRNSSS